MPEQAVLDVAPKNGVVGAEPAQPARVEESRKIFDALTEKARDTETGRTSVLERRRAEEAEQPKDARKRDKFGRYIGEAKNTEVEREAAAPTKKITEAETDRTAKPASDEAPEGKEPDQDADATAEADAKALTALRRAKVPKAVIEGLSVEDRRQWGNELAEIQANTDRITKEYHELKKVKPEPEAKVETHKEPETSAPKSADIDKAFKALDGILGDETLSGALREALSASTKPLQEENAALKQSLEEGRAILNQVRIEGLIQVACADLRESHPHLRTREGRERVLKRAEGLAKDPDAYASYGEPLERMSEVLKDAYLIEFKDEIESARQSKAKETDRKRLGGQMTDPGRASLAAELKGKDRGEQIYLLMSREGLSGEEARKRVDGLR